MNNIINKSKVKKEKIRTFFILESNGVYKEFSTVYKRQQYIKTNNIKNGICYALKGIDILKGSMYKINLEY